jgi:hypothetical protein
MIAFVFGQNASGAGYPKASISKTECGDTVDLRPTLPKIRDQGSTGWCYAETIADLLSHKLHKSISGDQIALEFLRTNFTNLYMSGNTFDSVVKTNKVQYLILKLYNGLDYKFAGGNLDTALESAQKAKVCESSKFSPQNLNFLRDFENLVKFKETMDEAYSTAISQENGPYTESFPALPNRQEIIERFSNCREYRSVVNRIFPLSDLKPLTNVILESNRGTLITNLERFACRPLISIDNLKNKWVETYYDGRENKKILLAALSQGRPVGVALNPDFMRDVNYPSDEAYHASSIVGKRWNNDRCEFLVRDSHGPNCMLEGKKLIRKPYRCEEGYIWVDDSGLLPSIKQTLEIL